MSTPELLLQVNAITKEISYQNITKIVPDTYWTSDIVPVIYPNWDSDKDKLVLFAWYSNDTYMCQRRKYTMNFKTNAFEWRDYEMEQVDDGSGLALYNKFKETFFLTDSLSTQEYQNEFAKIYAETSQTSWLTVRLARNFLLDETDHVFLEDSPYTTAEKDMYKEYRKKLRDLPQSGTTDPADMKFPITPKYFTEIYLNKVPGATYLGDAGQFVKLTAAYGTTFREKITSYLIVRSITDGLYNTSFLDAFKAAGLVYEPINPVNVNEETFTAAEAEKTKDYLNKLIRDIDAGTV